MKNNKNTDKPLLFFLDAATPMFYVAIKDMKKEVVVERQYSHSDLKGEALLAVVKQLFDENGYNVHDIAFLCTTKGPGSLTGLRISMSILKTMAQILNIPIVCIPTLYALESSYISSKQSKNENIMTCLTARKNSFYVRFSSNNEEGFKQMSSETLCERLKNVNIVLWAWGSVPFDCDKQVVNSVILRLNPEVIFELCASKYQKNECSNYIECIPEYAGKSVAEKNFEKGDK